MRILLTCKINSFLLGPLIMWALITSSSEFCCLNSSISLNNNSWPCVSLAVKFFGTLLKLPSSVFWFFRSVISLFSMMLHACASFCLNWNNSFLVLVVSSLYCLYRFLKWINLTSFIRSLFLFLHNDLHDALRLITSVNK